MLHSVSGPGIVPPFASHSKRAFSCLQLYPCQPEITFSLSETVSSAAAGTAALLVTRDGAPPVRWDQAAPLGSGVTLTYSFLDALPAIMTPPSRRYAGFMPFNEEMRATARTSLAQWAALANVRFVETAGDSGQIRVRRRGTQERVRARLLSRRHTAGRRCLAQS